MEAEREVFRVAVTKLRMVLLRMGVHQKELAAATDIVAPRISEYATGRKKIPRHHLIKLAQALEVSPDDIDGIDTRRQLPRDGLHLRARGYERTA